MRIMSHPSYPHALPVHAVIERLREATASPDHEFWPDDLSLLDPMTVDASCIHGPRQVTDVYLLALAVRHDGKFATFDDAVPVSAVKSGERRHLVAL